MGCCRIKPELEKANARGSNGVGLRGRLFKPRTHRIEDPFRSRPLANFYRFPGEYSTGGKQKLLGISKRGNKYLRRLFVQGARSVPQQRHKQAPGLSSWLAQLLGRTHQNVVVVALASWFAWPGRSYIRTNAIALPFSR
jgi:hypothetical protein